MSGGWDTEGGGRTDVVCFVKDDDTVLAHLLGYLVCDLWVEEVVKGVDDDVCVW
jgi:hypothetical protein